MFAPSRRPSCALALTIDAKRLYKWAFTSLERLPFCMSYGAS
jgi:hypothetical protein